jgi:NhaA family Na+:H+ antiporter
LEAASGILLLAAAIASLIWANSAVESYQRIFGLPLVIGAAGRVPAFTVRELVNDGLMTLFFFVVGMEIKRELVLGELRTFGRAALPAVAALGGMLVPALVYLAFNRSGAARRGWGIPIATDIAFCIGVLTLLKRRVPQGLIVFVTALAIFDDIGGILVIALFYGHGLQIVWLVVAAAVAALLFAAGTRSVTQGMFYLAGGALLWYAVHRSGIHPTISGVVLGLAVPERLLTRFVQRMHPWVAFVIMPVFALANSGISLQAMTRSDLLAGVTFGTTLGLLVGKLVGIFTFTVAAVRLGLAPMPGDASPAKLLGASVVGGIGFTVALFIAALAFPGDAYLLLQAKLGILIGSLAAGLIGAAILRATPALPREPLAPAPRFR